MSLKFTRVVGLLLLLVVPFVALPIEASGQAPDAKKEAKRIKNVRKAIADFGTGPNARIELTLNDDSKLKGYISERRDEDFVITDEKTAATTLVRYEQVKTFAIWPAMKTVVHRNLSSPGRIFSKLAIGAGIALGGVVLICAVSKRCME